MTRGNRDREGRLPVKRIVVYTVGFAAIASICLYGFLAGGRTRDFIDTFGAGGGESGLYTSRFEGWSHPSTPILDPGARGEIVYDFTKDTDETVRILIEVPEIDGLAVLSHVFWNDQRKELPLRKGENAFNLNSFLGDGHGAYRLRIQAYADPIEIDETVTPVERLEVITTGPREMHWGAAAFFILAAAGIWLLIPWSLFRRREEMPWRETGKSRQGIFVTILIVAGAAIIVTAPAWLAPKRFDDMRAISNASVLAELGADTSRLYFRSPQRPGFLGFALPVVSIFPNKLTIVQTTPSDFYRQVWREYDRRGWSFGTRIFPEISLISCGGALLWLALLSALLRQAGFSPLAAAGGAVVAALIYRWALYNAVTITFNLLINLAAVAGYLLWVRSGRMLDALWSGLLLSLAGLTKTTAITSAFPIAIHLILLLASSPERRRRLLPQIGVYTFAAVLPVLFYYQVFLDGLFATLRQFQVDQKNLLPIHEEFPRRSPAAFFSGLAGLAGPFWTLPVAGVLVLLNRKSSSPGRTETFPHRQAFFASWLASSLLAPLAMPFIFSRFFVYAIPSLAYYSAFALEPIAGRLKRKAADQECKREETS